MSASDSKLVWDWPLSHTEDGVFTSREIDGKVGIVVDCKIFKDKEVKVIVDKDKIDIHCLHEEVEKSGLICKREISRCYRLPPSLDPKTVKHSLKNGELIITVEKKA
uniref:SHSP domain-containing protein n=1 Tax=Strongyloides stercoralis TaxID=6248 RepID=A0A0K0DVE0_STRER